MKTNSLIISKSSISARFFICLIVAFFYLLTDAQFLVLFMFVLAVFSFSFNKVSESESVLLSLFITIQFVWTLLIFLVFVFDVSPLKLTGVREDVLRAEYKELVLFMSSQFLFILTSLFYLPYKYKPKKIDSKWIGYF